MKFLLWQGITPFCRQIFFFLSYLVLGSWIPISEYTIFFIYISWSCLPESRGTDNLINRNFIHWHFLTFWLRIKWTKWLASIFHHISKNQFKGLWSVFNRNINANDLSCQNFREWYNLLNDSLINWSKMTFLTAWIGDMKNQLKSNYTRIHVIFVLEFEERRRLSFKKQWWFMS